MIRRAFHTILIFVLAALALAPVAYAAGVGVHRLPNGVTVLTMPSEWNRIVAVSVMVDAGSKHDPPKLAGLAYLTASMLPQGTATRSAAQLAAFVDSSGISLGTETTHDYAHIYVTTIDSRLDDGLEIITDVLQHPAFDEKRLLDAQRVAHDRLDAREDDPFNTPFTRVSSMIFDSHPYALPVEGTTSGIDRITAPQLIKFHDQRYVGGSTVIAVVGNFSTDHVLDRLAALLKDYPSGNAPAAASELPAPPSEPQTVEIYADVDEAYLAMGFTAPSAGSDDYPVIAVIDALMGVGSASRLNVTLGPQGSDLVDAVGSRCMCWFEASAFIMYASTSFPGETVKAFEAAVEQLANEPAAGEELSDAKNRVIGRYVIAGQTNLVRAARLAVSELEGLGYEAADSFLSEVNRVDKNDIMRVASQWLRKPATVIVYPGKASAPARTTRRPGI
jgi:zinc protease